MEVARVFVGVMAVVVALLTPSEWLYPRSGQPAKGSTSTQHNLRLEEQQMEIFNRIEEHMQELENGQRATTRELKNLTARSESMEDSMRQLRGELTSLGVIVTEMLSVRARLEQMETRLEALTEVERRLNTLEQRQPPAA